MRIIQEEILCIIIVMRALLRRAYSIIINRESVLYRPVSIYPSFYLHSRVFMSTEASGKHKQDQEAPSTEPASKKSRMTSETVPKVEPKYSTKITLTEEESHIFTTLLDVVKTSGCKSVLRAAGGWVRDKVGDLLIFILWLYIFILKFYYFSIWIKNIKK